MISPVIAVIISFVGGVFMGVLLMCVVSAGSWR